MTANEPYRPSIDEAIDAIYDAKRGCFRDLGGEPVTADNLPRKGDLLFRAMPNYIGFAKWDWSVDDMCHGDTRILHRAEQPEPDLIYFPWPHYGNVGVIGPRGDVLPPWKFYHVGGMVQVVDPLPKDNDSPRMQKTVKGFRFPADADLIWVRDESEVPADLLKEARER